ncbi:hypothetical protein JCM11641_006687 [Rhodosporidiobolus odoratus]
MHSTVPSMTASSSSANLHSTSSLLSSFTLLAHNSLDDHIQEYADAHRWIDSFFEKLEHKPGNGCAAPRLAMSELMKTPGRKRTVGANSANHLSIQHFASAKKDPVATLLFPPSSVQKLGALDKENSPAPASSKNSSPRRMLSPAGASKGKAPAALSPLRLASPRAVLSPKRPTSTPVKNAPVIPSPELVVFSRDFAAPAEDADDVFGAGGHDLSNVVEEDEEEEGMDEQQESAKKEVSVPEAIEAEEEKVNLSIIGEEEEEEDDGTDVSAVTAPSTQPAVLTAQSSVIAETQFSQPAPLSPAPLSPAPAVPAKATTPLSPRAVAESSALERDANGDSSVPLNDAPSSYRTAHPDSLSSSLSASANTRTPGNTSRFGAGLYSAAKLNTGSVGLGSSPPPTAPSTTGKHLANARTSTGGNGARLNFVGLPKKSLGLGLGLGRAAWGTTGSSQVSDSQPASQGSNSAVSQPPLQSLHTASAPVASAHPAHTTFFELAQTGATTATGATKRKSLDGPDSANKTARLSAAVPQTAQEQEAEEARKRREALANRLQNLQARQSNIASGRTSNVANPFGSAIFTGNKPHANPPSALFLPISTSTATISNKPLAASSSAILPGPAGVSPSAEVANPLSRRPSVMERVKSFEQTTTTHEHLIPHSPSKIPAAFARSTSPGPKSPRGYASPPASPRPLTRSNTSGLPLATFGSPKLPQFAPPIAPVGFGSPKLGGVLRSPPSAAPPSRAPSPGPVSISAVLSPSAPQAKPAAVASPTRFVPPAITAKPTLPPQAVRSTTPDGSPPPPPAQPSLHSILATFDTSGHVRPAATAATEEGEGEEDDYEEEEEDEEDVPEIRAINASVPPAAVLEAQAKAKAKAQAEAAERDRVERERAAEVKRAAEQAARELEEQEVEKEREELMKKRLPSLPQPQVLTPDEEEEEEDGHMSDAAVVDVLQPKQAAIVATAAKENLAMTASPTKIAMPGTFGAQMVSATKAARQDSSQEEASEEDENEEEEGEIEEDDRTTMSLASAATSTFNYTAHAQNPFKPVTAHKQPQLHKQGSQASIASSSSANSALGLNRSVGNGASSLKKPESQVKAIQRAAAAAKKEKEERDRKVAAKEEKRMQLEKEKRRVEEERRAKADGMEKKRKEREEAATKAKANSIRGVKPKTDEESAKKRRIEPEPKVHPSVKKAAQPGRPLTASTSSQHINSLASSQIRPVGPQSALNKSAGPSSALGKSAGLASALNKSAGASSMIGQKFMSNQIRLPDGNNQAPRMGPTMPKPFSVSQSSMRPPQQPAPALKPEEPYQELPEIDSEYSDSDDEAHEKKVAAFPGWAQSPNLAQALHDQRKINPDDVFGPIPRLAIQEFFHDSSSAARLRARTSSAQWDGTDGLTQTDLKRYHRVMGFKTGLHVQQNGDDGASGSSAHQR